MSKGGALARRNPLPGCCLRLILLDLKLPTFKPSFRLYKTLLSYSPDRKPRIRVRLRRIRYLCVSWFVNRGSVSNLVCIFLCIFPLLGLTTRVCGREETQALACGSSQNSNIFGLLIY